MKKNYECNIIRRYLWYIEIKKNDSLFFDKNKGVTIFGGKRTLILVKSI